MTDENGLRVAAEVFGILCRTLDEIGWKYDRDDEKMIVRLVVDGDNKPMNFVIRCDSVRQLISVLAFLPFRINKDKIVDGAIATSYVNYHLAGGCFDFNIEDGSILFRITSSFRSSLIGDELIRYLIRLSCDTVDKYSGQFSMISEGSLSVEDFLMNN